MKAHLSALALTFSVLASHSALAGTQTESIDYNRGYCVPSGVFPIKENAIVVIDHQKMSGVFIPMPKNHMFFAPYSAENLQTSDWGGDMHLTKTGEVDGHVITVFYENHTHYNNVEKQLVLCVADGVFL